VENPHDIVKLADVWFAAAMPMNTNAAGRKQYTGAWDYRLIAHLAGFGSKLQQGVFASHNPVLILNEI
jgi:hypothetical protein